MIQNKMISFRPFVSAIRSVFFLLILVSTVVSADAKIGLDLEWRPIKGVKKPVSVPPSEGRRSQPGSSGKNWTDPVTGMAFVWVPGGCYQMGCGSWAGKRNSGEKPVHEVCLDGFWMGKYEVTQGQWEKVMGGNPSRFMKGRKCPVEKVSWNDCQTFLPRSHAPRGNVNRTLRVLHRKRKDKG